jgi:hypothetical protein
LKKKGARILFKWGSSFAHHTVALHLVTKLDRVDSFVKEYKHMEIKWLHCKESLASKSLCQDAIVNTQLDNDDEYKGQHSACDQIVIPRK